MAQWRPISGRKREVIEFNGGLNYHAPAASIKDNQLSYTMNMDTKDFPALSVRPGRSRDFIAPLASSQDLQAYGIAEDRYHLLGGERELFAVDVKASGASTGIYTISTGLSGDYPLGGHAGFAELKTGLTNYVAYVNSTQKKLFQTSPAVTTAVDISDTNLPSAAGIIAGFKGRVYALYNKILYYSALNAPTDWTTANDAGSIAVTNMVGIESALVEYNDNLIIFGARSMHILYGSGPGTYQIVDLEGNIGCYGPRAFVKSSGKLFWIDRYGIYMYGGGEVIRISESVQRYVNGFTDVRAWVEVGVTGAYVAGAQGKYVYFSVSGVDYGSTGGNFSLTLKYDTELNVWLCEDTYFTFMQSMQGRLTGVRQGFPAAADNTLTYVRDEQYVYDFYSTATRANSSNHTPISWSFITKAFNDGVAGEHKTISDMYATFKITPSRSTGFSIGYSTLAEDNDSTAFTGSTVAGSSDPYVLFTTNAAGSSNTQNRHIQIPVGKLQNVPWYRLRFAGSGPATINSLEKNLRVKRR